MNTHLQWRKLGLECRWISILVQFLVFPGPVDKSSWIVLSAPASGTSVPLLKAFLAFRLPYSEGDYDSCRRMEEFRGNRQC